MSAFSPDNQLNTYSLNEAAQKLDVSIDTLLNWNEYNILKPTITHTGEVAYRQEQIEQFMAIRQLSQNSTPNTPDPITPPLKKHFSITPYVFISAGVACLTVGILTRPIKVDFPVYDAAQNQTASLMPTPELIFGEQSSANIITYGQTSYFATSEAAPNANVLASVIGTNGLIQSNNPTQKTADFSYLFVTLPLVLLAVPFIFKKQFTHPKPLPELDISNSDLPEQKIIEVNQKTDGTVVLCFAGQEYKISKPELDSESDQFIERLMGLVAPDKKEIDYDSFTDEKVKLSAPLSKLVTRLGFIGVKRDLFFPRTSKNKVHFRKYLTNHDLFSMNLNPHQITGDFLARTT